MFDKVMQGFVIKEDVSPELVKKYEKELPLDILKIWKDYGLGSICSGFLKIINPDWYLKFVKETFFIDDTIPIMVTGTGEIIAWVNHKFIYMIDYKKNTFECLACGFDFWWEDLHNDDIEHLDKRYEAYKKKVNKFGELEYEECFVMDKKVSGNKIEIHEYLNKLISIYGTMKDDEDNQDSQEAVFADKSGMFSDFGFKLVVINSLLDKEVSFSDELEDMKEKYIDGFDDYGSYKCINEMVEFFENLKLTDKDLDSVTELCFDGGEDIYFLIMPDWDGESDEFLVRSVEGFELLKNLKFVEYISMCDEELMGEFENAGIKLTL